MSAAKVKCPTCAQTLKLKESLPPGAKVRCPKCGEKFRYEHTGADAGRPYASPAVPPPPVIAITESRATTTGGSIASAAESASPPISSQPAPPLASGGAIARKSSPRTRSKRSLPKFAAVLAAIGIVVVAWGLFSLTGGGEDLSAPGSAKSLLQYVANLPSDKQPLPGPEGQVARNAANGWLRMNATRKQVELELFVDRVEVADQGDGTSNANLIVTVDPALDAAVSLADGVWGGDFELNGTPYYLELWGEYPLITGLNPAAADHLRSLERTKVKFDCVTNDYEFQEGDDEKSLKLVVTFAKVTPPGAAAQPAKIPPSDSLASNESTTRNASPVTPTETSESSEAPASVTAAGRVSSVGSKGVLELPLANPILDVAWSPDGRRLAAFDSAGTATLWDVASRTGLDVSPTNDGPSSAGELRTLLRHVAFSPNGKFLAVGTSWKIAVIELPSGRIRWETGETFEGGPLLVDSSVRFVALFKPKPNPQDEHATCLSVREIATGRELFQSPPIDVERFPRTDHYAVSADGKLLAVATSTKMRLFDIPARQELPGIPGVISKMNLAFSSDSRQLMLLSGNGERQYWNVSNPARPVLARKVPWKQDGPREQHRSKGGLTALSANGKVLAHWGAGADTVEIVDAVAGNARTVINSGDQSSGLQKPEISCVALDANGTRAAIGTVNGTIVLRDFNVAADGVRPWPPFALRFRSNSLNRLRWRSSKHA